MHLTFNIYNTKQYLENNENKHYKLFKIYEYKQYYVNTEQHFHDYNY